MSGASDSLLLAWLVKCYVCYPNLAKLLVEAPLYQLLSGGITVSVAYLLYACVSE